MAWPEIEKAPAALAGQELKVQVTVCPAALQEGLPEPR